MKYQTIFFLSVVSVFFVACGEPERTEPSVKVVLEVPKELQKSNKVDLLHFVMHLQGDIYISPDRLEKSKTFENIWLFNSENNEKYGTNVGVIGRLTDYKGKRYLKVLQFTFFMTLTSERQTKLFNSHGLGIEFFAVAFADHKENVPENPQYRLDVYLGAEQQSNLFKCSLKAEPIWLQFKKEPDSKLVNRWSICR